jgi:hypothetical protein
MLAALSRIGAMISVTSQRAMLGGAGALQNLAGRPTRPRNVTTAVRDAESLGL